MFIMTGAENVRTQTPLDYRALSLGLLSASSQRPPWLLVAGGRGREWGGGEGDTLTPPHPTQAVGTHTPRELGVPGNYVPWGSPYPRLMGVDSILRFLSPDWLVAVILSRAPHGAESKFPGCLSFPGLAPLPAFPGDTSCLLSSYQLLSQDLFSGAWPREQLYLNGGIRHHFHHHLFVLSNCSLKNRSRITEEKCHGERSGSQQFFFFFLVTAPAPAPHIHSGAQGGSCPETRVVGEGRVSYIVDA